MKLSETDPAQKRKEKAAPPSVRDDGLVKAPALPAATAGPISLGDVDRSSADLKTQIEILNRIFDDHVNQTTEASDDRLQVERTNKAIKDRIDELKRRHHLWLGAPKYETPIRATDRDPQLTARKASQLYTKIPYYIAGTNEIGEFWVEPTVSDSGEMTFVLVLGFRISIADSTRAQIDLSAAEIEETKKARRKLRDWSETAT